MAELNPFHYTITIYTLMLVALGKLDLSLQSAIHTVPSLLSSGFSASLTMPLHYRRVNPTTQPNIVKLAESLQMTVFSQHADGIKIFELSSGKYVTKESSGRLLPNQPTADIIALAEEAKTLSQNMDLSHIGDVRVLCLGTLTNAP